MNIKDAIGKSNITPAVGKSSITPAKGDVSSNTVKAEASAVHTLRRLTRKFRSVYRLSILFSASIQQVKEEILSVSLSQVAQQHILIQSGKKFYTDDSYAIDFFAEDYTWDFSEFSSITFSSLFESVFSGLTVKTMFETLSFNSQFAIEVQLHFSNLLNITDSVEGYALRPLQESSGIFETFSAEVSLHFFDALVLESLINADRFMGSAIFTQISESMVFSLERTLEEPAIISQQFLVNVVTSKSIAFSFADVFSPFFGRTDEEALSIQDVSSLSFMKTSENSIDTLLTLFALLQKETTAPLVINESLFRAFHLVFADQMRISSTALFERFTGTSNATSFVEAISLWLQRQETESVSFEYTSFSQVIKQSLDSCYFNTVLWVQSALNKLHFVNLLSNVFCIYQKGLQPTLLQLVSVCKNALLKTSSVEMHLHEMFQLAFDLSSQASLVMTLDVSLVQQNYVADFFASPYVGQQWSLS